MTKLRVTAGEFKFNAKLEKELAPSTCAAFERLMPFIGKLVHVRWSGEGIWIPLGDMDLVWAMRTIRVIPPLGRLFCIQGELVKRKSFSHTVELIFLQKWDN